MASLIPLFFTCCCKAFWDPGAFAEMVAPTGKDVQAFTIGFLHTSKSNGTLLLWSRATSTRDGNSRRNASIIAWLHVHCHASMSTADLL